MAMLPRMIPNHAPNSLETTGEAVAAFGVSRKDEAHVLGILRDQIYSDKVLAVVREYSTNAWDANRSAGRGETPIAVHLPTIDEPWFAVSDEGPGLSPTDVAEVFTKYGASTKRDDPNQVGMLGIGSKSAFAYASQFTVVSRHGGKCRTYVAALDASDLGTITLLSEEDCGATTGDTVQVAVRPRDVEAFCDKAAALYLHFHPTPECGREVDARSPAATVVTLDSGLQAWVERDLDHAIIAVMGCVPYRVDLDQLDLPEEAAWVRGARVTIQFPIGAVQFAASREELRYTEHTKAALLGALGECTDKLVSAVLAEVESETTSAFAKRVKLLSVNQLGLPLPEEYEDLAKSQIQLVDRYDVAVPFTLWHDGNVVGRVSLTPSLRFFYQDQPNKLSGYALSEWDYVVCPRAKTKAALAEAQTSFEGYVEGCGLSGVPVGLISSVPWTRPVSSRGDGRSGSTPEQRARYKASMFVLKPHREWPHKRYGGGLSGRWDPVHRVPEDTDVFVEFTKFETAYGDLKFAERVLSALGEPLPPIYGYKEGKGTLPRAGQRFGNWWLAKKSEVLARPEVHQALLDYEACTCLPHLTSDAIADLRRALGDTHPLVAPYVATLGLTPPAWAQEWYELSGWKTYSAPARKALEHALSRYPLLNGRDWNGGYRPALLDYVQLVDERDARAAAAISTAA